MEMEEPDIIGSESSSQPTTYDDLIRTAGAIKMEKDSTPIAPDPIIAAANVAQIANMERAASFLR